MHLVIGGGPAGFFAAITARRADPDTPVVLLERGSEVLRKVLVSGGGRCNVTHDCDDPAALIEHYPRGGRELRGPFHHFGPAAVADWFTTEGVALKTEDDGRRFPTTDRSTTIVESLVNAARNAGVDLRTGCRVTALSRDDEGFICRAGGEDLRAAAIVLATGGKTSAVVEGPDGYDLARELGHTVVPPVPSLFTFRCDASWLRGLPGVSADVALRAAGHRTQGPLLITHKGVSGPAVLRLSAWGARDLHDLDYRFDLRIDWLPDLPDVDVMLQDHGAAHGRRLIAGDNPTSLPRRLWSALVLEAGVPEDRRWADLGRKPRLHLADTLKNTVLPVEGQSPFKDEFVTCGGVALTEVDLRTMASRVCPGLHLAGEVLDVDGLTGGFNFQNCWTTGWLAGRGLGAGKGTT